MELNSPLPANTPHFWNVLADTPLESRCLNERQVDGTHKDAIARLGDGRAVCRHPDVRPNFRKASKREPGLGKVIWLLRFGATGLRESLHRSSVYAKDGQTWVTPVHPGSQKLPGILHVAGAVRRGTN